MERRILVARAGYRAVRVDCLCLGRVAEIDRLGPKFVA